MFSDTNHINQTQDENQEVISKEEYNQMLAEEAREDAYQLGWGEEYDNQQLQEKG